MGAIRKTALPDLALLQRYRVPGCYSDCYTTTVPERVSHSAFVKAFYTSWLFVVERVILKYVAAKPSTNAQADQLANGATEHFAAWQVEDRTDDQLLLTDFRGRTRSWLMTRTEPAGGTRLYFGSAVTPTNHGKTGEPTLGLGFRALLGFHRLYSRALLSCARRSLVQGQFE